MSYDDRHDYNTAYLIY